MIFNQFQFIFPSYQPLHLHWNRLFPVSVPLSSSWGSFVVIFKNVFAFLLDLPFAHESEIFVGFLFVCLFLCFFSVNSEVCRVEAGQ